MKKTEDPLQILGVPFLPLTREELNERLEQLLQASANARIFTPNPEIVQRAQSDPDLMQALMSADLLLPDGIGILLAARLLGKSLPQRLTGIDTAEWLLQYAADHSLSVFLLGGREGVAEQAALCLCARFKGLRICGTHHGYFDRNGEENQALLQAIRSTFPDLLLVCLGSPTQEIWIHQYAHTVSSLRLSIGLGGALDVWSGNVRRAPRCWQACGVEWLWRVIREPKRARRLLVLPSFFFSLLKQKQEKKRTLL